MRLVDGEEGWGWGLGRCIVGFQRRMDLMEMNNGAGWEYRSALVCIIGVCECKLVGGRRGVE